MSSIKDRLKKEVQLLIEKAAKIEEEELNDFEKNKDKIIPCPSTLHEYQIWYSKTLNLISQILPERLEEFVSFYQDVKRKIQHAKEYNSRNYTISDFLCGVRIIFPGTKRPKFNHFVSFMNKFRYQASILLAAEDRLDSILSDIKGILEAEMFDSELEAARELLNKGFLRSSGALAGVILERHLATVVNSKQIQISNKNPNLADYNEALKSKGVYDVPKWRFMQRLADIRNLCAHSKDREPEKDEVDELLNGVDKVVKTFF